MNKIKQYFFCKDGEFSWWKSIQNIILTKKLNKTEKSLSEKITLNILKLIIIFITLYLISVAPSNMYSTTNITIEGNGTAYYLWYIVYIFLSLISILFSILIKFIRIIFSKEIQFSRFFMILSTITKLSIFVIVFVVYHELLSDHLSPWGYFSPFLILPILLYILYFFKNKMRYLLLLLVFIPPFLNIIYDNIQLKKFEQECLSFRKKHPVHQYILPPNMSSVKYISSQKIKSIQDGNAYTLYCSLISPSILEQLKKRNVIIECMDDEIKNINNRTYSFHYRYILDKQDTYKKYYYEILPKNNNFWIFSGYQCYPQNITDSVIRSN